MNDKDIATKRLIDLSRLSYERGIYTFSDFLTLAEQSDLINAARSGQLYDSNYRVFGGYEGAERVCVAFGSVKELGYEQEWPISCIKISPLNQKFAEDLSHRDFLGSLMNLGFERHLLGDILITKDESSAYLFALEHIAETICRELIRIRHTSVIASIVENPSDIPKPSLTDINLQVKSERIDLVIAHIYQLSRSASSQLFLGKKVFINGRLMENESHKLENGDLISVRGYGRFIYKGVAGSTRKGNLIVSVSKW